MARQAYKQNTYIFDQFLQRPIQPIGKEELGPLGSPEWMAKLPYSAKDAEWIDFAKWLAEFIQSEAFLKLSDRFIEIMVLLLEISRGPEWSKLYQESQQLNLSH